MKALLVLVAVLAPSVANAQYNVPSQASGERGSVQIAAGGAEIITLPEGLKFGGELGASLDFMTSDPSLGGKPLKFTDLVLFRLHGLLAIGKRTEVFAGVDLLPKQPSFTDEHRWQGALAGARFVLPHSLSAYARGSFGPNLGHDGFWIAGEAAGQYKRDLAERVLYWESSLGVTYTKLLFDDRSTSVVQTDLLATTGIALRDSKNGIFAVWLSFGFHFPLVNSPTEQPDPPLVRPTDPQVRVGVFLGTVLGVTKTLDLFVEVSILDRGDVEDPATTLPILAGGFDQTRILFGFNRRFGTRERR